MSLLWETVSNALEKSIATATVLCGGWGWLNPKATLCERGRRAVVVERFVRKPCCVDDRGRVFSSGVRRRSRTLTVGDKRDMGRYPDPKLAYLPGLRTGMTMECFHMEGMVAVLYERLYRWVSNAMPRGPRCFKWWMVRPSGPTARELPLSLMALETRCVVKGEMSAMSGRVVRR